MKTRYSFLLFAFFTIPGVLNAQKKNASQVTAIICGTTDSANRIEILFYPKNVVSNYKFATQYNSEVVDHNFKIKIPDITEPSYVTIIFRYPVFAIKSLELYLIEPGDSINISQYLNTFYFPGKNSTKFSCQYKIQQVKSGTYLPPWARSKDIYRDLELRDRVQDSICAVRLQLLADAKFLFGHTAYDIIRSDCIYDPSERCYANMDFILRATANDSNTQKQVISYYLDHYFQKAFDTTNALVKSRSYKFINLLLRKTMVDGEMALKGYKPEIYNFRALIDSNTLCKLGNNYTGILKQYLLTNFFAQPARKLDSLNGFLTSAVEQVNQSYLHNILLDVQRKSKGVPAYNFTLPDSNGKKVTLSNYKGKVVVVDFWFTGCEWCIEMAKVLKTAAAAKDTNIVFITINVDNSKSMWKESLKRGIFTSTDEINLYTDGMGRDHPLVNYYRISGYPMLLVIDKAGKLFAVKPELGFGTETGARNLKKITLEVAKQVL